MEDAKELEILFPERELTIGGRNIVVREFTFLEGLKAGAMATELLDDLARILKPDSDISMKTLLEAFGHHAGILLELIRMATGEDQAFLEGLNREDGERLLMSFWQANQDFFGNRLALRWLRESQKAEA